MNLINLHRVAEPANRVVMVGTLTDMEFFHNRIFRNGFWSIKILKEVLRLRFIGIGFQEFSPFYEILNGEALRMIAGGILQLSWRYEVNPRGVKKIEEEIGPQVLDHLEIGFVICSIPLAIGASVFFVEFLIPRVKVLCHKLIAFVVVRAYVRCRLPDY